MSSIPDYNPTTPFTLHEAPNDPYGMADNEPLHAWPVGLKACCRGRELGNVNYPPFASLTILPDSQSKINRRIAETYYVLY